MLLKLPTAADHAGWRPLNHAGQVTLAWVSATDGPTGERRGYFSMTTGRADGSVAVDVPGLDLGWFAPGPWTEPPWVPEKEGEPFPSYEQHKHLLPGHNHRLDIPALSFTVWLRSPGQGQADVSVALWATRDDPPQQTFEVARARVRQRWERVEVLHGPYPSTDSARCEVSVQSTGRPVHLAGAVLV